MMLTGQETTLKPYCIKSGIIEYRYSGDKAGTGTLWFDDYGLKCAMQMEVVSEGEKSNSWIVTIGSYQYLWDTSKPAEGLKMENPILKWVNEASKEEIDSYTESMYVKLGMTKKATETFLGKECKSLKGDIGKVLTWKGIMMLLDMSMGTYVSHQEATSIKTNVPIDARYFVIPKNVTFSEMPMF